jgi:hypothetical protein
MLSIILTKGRVYNKLLNNSTLKIHQSKGKYIVYLLGNKLRCLIKPPKNK